MLDNNLDTVGPEVAKAGPVRDSSQARVPLLAFVADDDTEAALRGGLLNTVESVEVHRGTILHAIKHLAKEPTPRALVVDIARVPNPLDELDNLSRVCTPDVQGPGDRRQIPTSACIANWCATWASPSTCTNR